MAKVQVFTMSKRIARTMRRFTIGPAGIVFRAGRKIICLWTKRNTPV